MTLDRSRTRAKPAIDKFIANALMVPLMVEVKQVLINSAAQVPFAEQDDLAEALLLDRSDEAFSIGVGIRCPVRCLDEFDTGGCHHVLEAASEVRVPVADQEPTSLKERAAHLAAWPIHMSFGCLVMPARCTRRVLSSIMNST